VPNLIHVIDDDTAFRTAMGRLLRNAGYEVALYDSGRQFLQLLPIDVAPGCILLDVRIPGLSGPELQDELIRRGSALPIIFLTGHGDIPTTVRVTKAGAEDFLTKPVRRAKLLETIERAVARYEAGREERDRMSTLRALLARLTPREHQVFRLVVQGHMNKQIAHVLGTTERTIKAHRQRVMEKVHARSLAELVSIAERLDIARPEVGAGAAGAAEPQIGEDG
jgi:RNA polymerase sigma factor (sigma-70 family)